MSGSGLGSLASGNPLPYHGDFVSPEQIIPQEGIRDINGNPLIWEACFTMNDSWGYNLKDKYFKPAPMLIRKLVECVSKGGNMLLNVGPDARGNFPEESVSRLKEIGKWMEKNGESIYGCGMFDMPVRIFPAGLPRREINPIICILIIPSDRSLIGIERRCEK